MWRVICTHAHILWMWCDVMCCAWPCCRLCNRVRPCENVCEWERQMVVGTVGWGEQMQIISAFSIRKTLSVAKPSHFTVLFGPSQDYPLCEMCVHDNIASVTGINLYFSRSLCSRDSPVSAASLYIHIFFAQLVSYPVKRAGLALVLSGPFSFKEGQGQQGIFRWTGSWLVAGSIEEGI